MDKRDEIQKILIAFSEGEIWINKATNDILALLNVVRSVFTIHSTADEGIIKIVGTEEEAKQEVLKFAEEHKYADFFYEQHIL